MLEKQIVHGLTPTQPAEKLFDIVNTGTETKTQQERQGPARVGRTRERVKVPVEIGTRQRDSDRK